MRDSIQTAPSLRVDPADEGPHPEDPAVPLWSESYYLDGITDDGALGFYIRVGDTRNLGTSMVSLVIARPGRPSIILSTQEAPPLAHEGTSATVTTPAYTATFDVKDPLQEYAITFDGTAQTFPDEGAILRGEQGEPIQVTADLTWTTTGLDYRWPGLADRYEIPCRVTGTITVTGEEFPFVGNGQRDHSWGNRDWWANSWMWNAFWLDDGSRTHSAVGRGGVWARGYWQRGERLVDLSQGDWVADYDGDGRMRAASFRLDEAGVEVTVEPTAYGNLLLISPEGTPAHFVRAMADFTTADGRTGRGWIEWECLLGPDGEIH
ncbi:DUF7065 domain-containing protein [Nocardioides insulae]|uniref:DUF7064 domain-containing protein n=1 Tax=Nocardioides insulae TaxID=394734 RepID=UPI00042A566D|nr:hypothetical protein [Nocardioides insulae]